MIVNRIRPEIVNLRSNDLLTIDPLHQHPADRASAAPREAVRALEAHGQLPALPARAALPLGGAAGGGLARGRAAAVVLASPRVARAAPRPANAPDGSVRFSPVALRGTTAVFALPLVVGGLALSACGSSSGTSTSRTTTGSGNHLPGTTGRLQPVPPGSAPPSPPHIGSAQRVPAPGTTLIVTVTSVIDPLRGSGASIPQGTKPVGVTVKVRNAGPGSYDSSGTGDFSLLSGSGQASPVYVPSGQCQTPLQDFMNELSAGVVRTGCVAFAVPTGQAPTTVRFAPNGGANGHSRSWAVG